MIKIVEKIRKFSLLFVSLLSLGIIFVIFLYNLKYSSLTFNNWFPVIRDAEWPMMLVLALSGFVFLFLIYSIIQNRSRKTYIALMIGSQVLGLCIRLAIVLSFRNQPIADGWEVFNGANALFISHDPNFLFPGSYFGIYPQQLGIAVLLYPLVKLFQYNVIGIYLSQAVLIQIGMVCLSSSAWILKGAKAAAWSSLLLNMFIPSYFLSFFIYGEVYQFVLISVVFLLNALSTKDMGKKLRILVFIGMGIVLFLSYYARLSTNVFLIAFVLVIVFFRKLNFASMAKILLIISLFFLPTLILEQYFNQRYQVALSENAFPSNTWLRIGLGYSSFDHITPAFHDHQTEIDFNDVGYNRSQMESINQKAINDRIEQLFSTNEFVYFFSKKVAFQWTDPDYEMMTVIFPFTGTYLDAYAESQKSDLGSGHADVQPTNGFGEWLQSNYHTLRLVEKGYLMGILAFMLLILIRIKRNTESLFLMRLLMIGFFLMHLLIEIKGRYVLVLMMFMVYFIGIESDSIQWLMKFKEKRQ